MLHLKVISLLVGLIVLSGCAVSIKFPANHFITSETSGRPWGGEIDLRAAGVSNVEVISSRFSSTPGQTPSQSENTAVGVGGELGVANFVDLFVSNGSEGPIYAGAKFQILGDGRATAKEGNLSLAIAGAAALFGGSDEASEDSVTSDAEREFSGYLAAVSLGYRPTDKILVYGGPFTQNVSAKVTLTRTENGTSTVTATPEGDFKQFGAAAGARFGKGDRGLFGIVEISYATNSYERTSPSALSADDLDEFFLGGKVGFAW